MKKEDDLLSLNIGCGNERIGDVRLDFKPTEAANIVADAEKLPFANESFACIYERNVLEHMTNPGGHLYEVARVLKKGGRLTLITDNAACLKYYLLGTHMGGYSKLGHRCRNIPSLLVGGDCEKAKDKHYAIFTIDHLKNLLEHAGFNVEDLSLVDTDYFTRPFDSIVRFFLPELSYPRIRVEATK